MRNDIFIGIDPDSEKSGLCLIDKTRKIEFATLDLLSIFDFIGAVNSNEDSSIHIGIEGGFTKKAVWHEPPFLKTANVHSVVSYMCKIAENVGRCNQTAVLIKSYCDLHGIDYMIVPLQPKIWKNGKISTEEIERRERQKIGRCNQDERDAYIIADYVRNNIYKQIQTKIN